MFLSVFLLTSLMVLLFFILLLMRLVLLLLFFAIFLWLCIICSVRMIFFLLVLLLSVLILNFYGVVFLVLFLKSSVLAMTRTYCRQYCPGDSWSYDIVSRVYDKSELAIMFSATFDREYKLVSLNIANISLPNPMVGTELQHFLVHAYKVCSGVDSGLIEFQLLDNF